MKTFCVFCKTGAERDLVEYIHRMTAGVTAFAPVRVVYEKRKGVWDIQERPLIPGYVFIYMDETIALNGIRALTDVYKVLGYDETNRQLMGSDDKYAQWIYKHKGRIDPSTVLIEGDRVKVADGPLADGIGTIVKLDHHKRRATVEFDFDGRKLRVSLTILEVDVDR